MENKRDPEILKQIGMLVYNPDNYPTREEFENWKLERGEPEIEVSPEAVEELTNILSKQS